MNGRIFIGATHAASSTQIVRMRSTATISALPFFPTHPSKWNFRRIVRGICVSTSLQTRRAIRRGVESSFRYRHAVRQSLWAAACDASRRWIVGKLVEQRGRIPFRTCDSGFSMEGTWAGYAIERSEIF